LEEPFLKTQNKGREGQPILVKDDQRKKEKELKKYEIYLSSPYPEGYPWIREPAWCNERNSLSTLQEAPKPRGLQKQPWLYSPPRISHLGAQRMEGAAFLHAWSCSRCCLATTHSSLYIPVRISRTAANGGNRDRVLKYGIIFKQEQNKETTILSWQPNK
jgi:hypothetical protein